MPLLSKPLEPGAWSTCESCGYRIVFRGSIWQHEVDGECDDLVPPALSRNAIWHEPAEHFAECFLFKYPQTVNSYCTCNDWSTEI